MRRLSTGHGANCWGHKGAISMAPTCTACHRLGLTSAPEEVRSQTVSFMLLLNLRVCGELFMAPCLNGPTLMPLQPSSWYRETGCWHSWEAWRPLTSSPRPELLLSDAPASFASMRLHPARHAPTLSEERGTYGAYPHGRPTRNYSEAAKYELCSAQS